MEESAGFKAGGRLNSIQRRLFVIILILCGACITPTVMGDLQSDGEALLGFLNGLAASARVLNWVNSTSPCTWQGVGCSAAQDSVVSVKLPGMGLYGHILPSTLGSLSSLQTLSLRSNHLSGPLPADMVNCTRLRKLYLQNNLQLSGPIPPFSSTLTPALNVIDLSVNQFTGGIPPSLSTLSLRILLLQNNSLSGGIPQDLGGIVQINFANNNLSGSIPPGLRSMPSSSFSGNAGLCGLPLLVACQTPASPPPPPSPAPLSPPLESPQQGSKSRRKLTTLNIILIAVADAVFLVLVGACCLLWYSRKQLMGTSSSASSGKGELYAGKSGAAAAAYPKAQDYSKDELGFAQELTQNKLVFFQGKQLSFDLEDLLRASAEVLGKGSFGTSYKAVLEDGPTVVVKRLKEVSVGRKDFEQQLDGVGRLRHRHLVALRAYYYSKEEKLLVHEYLPLGSLAAVLHGTPKGALSWEARLRIGMGACKGLAHIHSTSSKAVHGNIKSSNVLLHGEYDACLSDYGLTALFSPNLVVGRTGGGYRAPEVIETRKVSQPADVFSFGVVLLEMLTGKAPWLTMAEVNMDLPRWVQAMVREEWTTEIFDKELLQYSNIEEEMVHMLQVALACISTSPSQRPRIHDVLTMISSIRPTLLQIESDSTTPSSTNNEASEPKASLPQGKPTDSASSDPSPRSQPSGHGPFSPSTSQVA